jgi:REP element-mobilizing transposase RayT
MARRLRVSSAGAPYYLINRGNYRRDVFATDSAVRAPLTTIDETCRRFGWRVHAYVVMSNHYRLAAQTPQANLSEGMHWLQTTDATRFAATRDVFRHDPVRTMIPSGLSARAAAIDWAVLIPRVQRQAFAVGRHLTVRR